MKMIDMVFSRNDKEYDVHITKKKMRRIVFHVRKGQIFISAPYLASKKLILDNLEQIFPRLELMLQREPPIEKEYIYLLGEKRALLENGKFSIMDHSVTCKTRADLERNLRKFALDYFLTRVRYYEEIMHISDPYKVFIRKMESRYGSNSRLPHRLTFSFKLIHYSQAIIDSIVVHELSHYFYFDHSRKFYETVLKYYPNYRLEHVKLKKGTYQ